MTLKTSISRFADVLALAMALGPAPALSLELGVDRSGLSLQSAAVQEKTLEDIRSLGATWFRDGPTSGSAQGVANFVNEVRLAKLANHLDQHMMPIRPYTQRDLWEADFDLMDELVIRQNVSYSDAKLARWFSGRGLIGL
jgi:hypothetical protein